MKYRMDVEYGKVKKPKPDYKWEKRTYGFRTEQELKSYRMGIEASSYVYDFDIKVNEYQETPKQLEFNFSWLKLF